MDRYKQERNEEVFRLAKYYEDRKRYDFMKLYYKMSIEQGNSLAMNALGLYYHKVEKDYDKMKEYYLLSIDFGNVYSMYNLGHYYEKIEKHEGLMNHYYLMAIVNGSSDALIRLEDYYKDNLKLFLVLENIQEKSILVERKRKQLLQTFEVSSYLYSFYKKMSNFSLFSF